MRILLGTLATVMVLAASASSQEKPQNINNNPNAAFFLSAADVTAHRNKLQNVAYANITLVERPEATSSSGVAYRMALDRRRPPQRAAAHATEGEIWAIVDGAGEITTGGKIVETKKGNEVVRRIEGGTVHKVSKGDFLLIPENVPHQVTAFTPELYMVTFEFPRGVKAGTK
jgi:mannose-6-phosphate isomerase-like protein (cupin superfamily)